MKRLILCAMLTLLAQTAFAITPLDRSALEIRDIVNSPQLRRLLPPSESIQDIHRMDRGYLLSTRRFQLYVEVVYGSGLKGAAPEAGDSGTGTLQFGELKEITQ